MKKLLVLVMLAVLLVSGSGVAGASDTAADSKETIRISQPDEGYTILRKPVIMD